MEYPTGVWGDARPSPQTPVVSPGNFYFLALGNATDFLRFPGNSFTCQNMEKRIPGDLGASCAGRGKVYTTVKKLGEEEVQLLLRRLISSSSPFSLTSIDCSCLRQRHPTDRFGKLSVRKAFNPL